MQAISLQDLLGVSFWYCCTSTSKIIQSYCGLIFKSEKWYILINLVSQIDRNQAIKQGNCQQIAQNILSVATNILLGLCHLSLFYKKKNETVLLCLSSQNICGLLGIYCKCFSICLFIHQNNPPLKSRSFSLASQGSANSPGVQRRPSQNAVSFFNVGHHRLPTGKRVPIMQPDHLVDVREVCMP